MCNTKNRSGNALCATRPNSEQKVSSGVIWLDQTHPGWRRRVRWDTLDMSDARHHLLSYLYKVPTGVAYKPPMFGWDVVLGELKAEYGKSGAYDWLTEHGFLESTDAWRVHDPSNSAGSP